MTEQFWGQQDEDSQADDFFGGTGKSWSWSVKNPDGTFTGKPAGSQLVGTIERIGEAQQQTDRDTGQPSTWPGGQPIMVLPVTLRTTLREDAEDDGLRTLWVQKGSLLFAKVRDAIKAAGSKLRQGGQLVVTLTGREPAKTGYKNLFEVTYTPPGGAPGQQPMSGQQVAQAFQQEPSAPSPELVPMVKQLADLGRPDEAIATALGLSLEQVNRMKEIPF